MAPNYSCCIFQFVFFSCGCPGERMLVRKGHCSESLACKPSSRRCITAKIRRHCSSCKNQAFYQLILNRTVQIAQDKFEQQESRSKVANSVRCNTCAQAVPIAELEGHECPEFPCYRCGRKWFAQEHFEQHECVHMGDAWALSSDGKGALTTVWSRDQIRVAMKARSKVPQTMFLFSLRSLSVLPFLMSSKKQNEMAEAMMRNVVPSAKKSSWIAFTQKKSLKERAAEGKEGEQSERTAQS